MLINDQIIKYLSCLKNKLRNIKRSNIKLSKEWFNKIPEEPGCYVAYENNDIVYAGETDNLRKRMRNLRNTNSHVLRENIGNSKFWEVKGFVKATSGKKFPAHIEKSLTEYIEDNIKISMMTVKLGRKELEELIINEFECVYNKKGKKK